MLRLEIIWRPFSNLTVKMNLVRVMATLKMVTVTTSAMPVATMGMIFQPLSLTGATPKKKKILMRKTWLFQMMKQTCTETQRHRSQLLLSLLH
jgi:hypothetical protein